MKHVTRRSFLKTAGVTAAAASIPLPATLGGQLLQAQAKQATRSFPFSLGIASYTFRAFKLEEAIEMTRRMGLQKLTLKEMHLPLTSSDEQIRAAIDKIKQAGLEADSCGVVYMKTEEEVKRAFAYARTAGMKMIVAGPEPPLLPLVERSAKETDIIVAIHNHGPTDRNYPSPESVYKAVANMDKRMGLCIDIGHTQRIGLDPAEQFAKCFDRVHDMHIKDETASQPGGTTLEMGRGVIDIPKLLREANRRKYAGTMHFEFEKDEKDPLPGLAESVGYVNGVLAVI
jgi:sugar phosphate isomerase/epimerase